MITKDNIRQLRQLPIERVAERLGLDVRRHTALCPFHDDHHASLNLSVSRNTFRCFVCDAHGGPIDLVMRQLHLSFVEACHWLASGSSIILADNRPQPSAEPHRRPFDPARYQLIFQRPYLNAEARRFLFAERHIDPRVASWCRLSSWTDSNGRPWLQIPYFDASWNLVGMQSRNLTPHAQPRFRFPSGARCTIYNLPVTSMLRPSDELYITEGCSDCWAMLSSGHKAIAIPSATLLRPSDVALFDALSQRGISFHIFPDSDLPGERLYLQLRDMIPGLVRHQLPPSVKDYAEAFKATFEQGISKASA